jgi:hypothetical protein
VVVWVLVVVSKVAMTLFARSMVTAQVALVPAQAPLQPVKVEPVAGVAERATLVPEA